MNQVRQTSIVKFEETGQVLVTGSVENVADRFLEGKPKLNLETTDGLVFRLSAGTDVQELDLLAGKKVSVLGTIDEFDEPPILIVLGYRILPAPPPDERVLEPRKSIKKKAA